MSSCVTSCSNPKLVKTKQSFIKLVIVCMLVIVKGIGHMHGVNIGMVERVNHICYDIHKIRIEFSTVTKTGKGLHLSLAIF